MGSIRSIAVLLFVAFSGGSALAQAPIAPSTAPVYESFQHLAYVEGGPGWTLTEIRDAIPPGTVAMEVQAGVPISRIPDASSALLAAINRLGSSERGDHELAFRIAGATIKQTGSPDAIRLMSYLMYHGIGTKRDASASVRSTLPLVRVGDYRACQFVASNAASTFKSAATNVAPEKLTDSKAHQPVHLSGTIVSQGDEQSVFIDGLESEIRLMTDVSRLATGRRIECWGLWMDDHFDALVAEVPEPSASFKWKVNAQPVRSGWWQVSSVSVTVMNNGVQPIKSVSFTVRCYMNNGAVNEQTVTAAVQEIPPGKSKAVNVDFEVYNYQYALATSTPKAEVIVKQVDW